MDFDNGGLSSSTQPPQSAAEIARKKVLAAYSSTVESLKNLPPEAQTALYSQSAQNQSYTTDQSQYQQPTPYQQQQSTPCQQPVSPVPAPVQTNWSATPSPEYQRTALYSQPTTVTTPTPQPATHASRLSRHFKRRPHFFNRDELKSAPNSVSTTPTNQSATAQSPQTASYSYSNIAQPPAESNPATSQAVEQTGMLKDAPIDQSAINAEWQQYHSAWQDYYKKYYSEYYAKAAQNYLATEKMKKERIANGQTARKRRLRHFAPIIIVGLIALVALFLQYNRLIFAPIMAYVSPDAGSVTTSLEAVDPTINQSVSPEPRLIIPKLNIDVPVEFNIPTTSVDDAMNHGVAQFSIPGANALPGQIGNLVITGHSAGDIYSSNPYKFIFSGLERLAPGDLIYVNYDSVRYTYQMTGSQTVEPTDVASLIYETDKPILTLITCTPLGTSRYRLLVIAEQISPTYSSDNVADPGNLPTSEEESSDPAMPANEPSFFENLWQAIFG